MGPQTQNFISTQSFTVKFSKSLTQMKWFILLLDWLVQIISVQTFQPIILICLGDASEAALLKCVELAEGDTLAYRHDIHSNS